MKRGWSHMGLAAGIAFQAFAPVQAERLVRIDSRPGVTQSFMLIEPDKPIAAVILYAGGDGRLDLGPEGPGKATNFLVRSRRLFADHGFVVAMPDAPSDLSDRADGLVGRRANPEHAEDTRAIIGYLAGRVKLPVWVIGTSRGSISAANAAARLGQQVAGVVLTASVTESSRRRAATVFDVALERITVPVLLAHHQDDACVATPYSGMAAIKRKLKAAPVIEMLSFTGGDAPRGKPCDALTPHGFLGTEAEVVSQITAWIKRHNP